MADVEFQTWRDDVRTDDPQRCNEQWWQEHPMSYDWEGECSIKEGSPEFFANIDRRFFEIQAHAAHPEWPNAIPFSALEDFSSLKGKKVLEIGCGFGSVAEALARCGVELTAIDLTQKAVDMTDMRLRQQHLSARVLKMDAEHLQFPDASFDFIWSWGVIHHSTHTEQIVSEMHRVLKPGGRFAVMVYHRDSTRYWISGVVRRGIVGMQLLKKTPDEIQMSFTDGFFARHFSRRQLRELFKQFELEKIRTMDMMDLSIPFRPLRKTLKKVSGEKRYWNLVRSVEEKFGWEMFVQGRKPQNSNCG